MAQPQATADDLLERFRHHRLPYKCDEVYLNLWHAACPACRSETWALHVREAHRNGPVSIRCANGCTQEQVEAVLEREPADVQLEAAEARIEEAFHFAERYRRIALTALSELKASRETSELAVAA